MDTFVHMGNEYIENNARFNGFFWSRPFNTRLNMYAP